MEGSARVMFVNTRPSQDMASLEHSRLLDIATRRGGEAQESSNKQSTLSEALAFESVDT